MFKFIKNSFFSALNLIAIVFIFVPELIFGIWKPCTNFSDAVNIIIVRIFVFLGVLFFILIATALYLHCRKKVKIKGNHYNIEVKYGDLLEMSNCKKIIPFDECFTTTVGDLPSEINRDSICGQYLSKTPIADMQVLIDNIQLKPMRSKSKYQTSTRYESGKLVPNGDDLLLAFAKLDEDGLGYLSYDEYLECLFTLWKEIDKHYNQIDICIPILGSGVTRMGDKRLSQQELLDIIIFSYKINKHKLNLSNKLYIICKKCDGFSLNKIGGNI